MRWKFEPADRTDLGYDSWSASHWQILQHKELRASDGLTDCGCKRAYRDTEHYLLRDLRSERVVRVTYTLEYCKGEAEARARQEQLRGRSKRRTV
jgi:hypothetical protein